MAARQEFSSKGLHGARVDEIAERAEANKQRIYAYYQNKENLFGEVLAHCFNEIAQNEQALLQLGERDIPVLTEKLLSHYVDFHARYPFFWRMLAWENLDEKRHVKTLPQARQQVFAHLGRLYAQGQERGNFKKDVTFETYLFGLMAVSFFLFANQKSSAESLKLDFSKSKVRDQFVKEFARLFDVA